jgi:hypothetical protein
MVRNTVLFGKIVRNTVLIEETGKLETLRNTKTENMKNLKVACRKLSEIMWEEWDLGLKEGYGI